MQNDTETSETINTQANNSINKEQKVENLFIKYDFDAAKTHKIPKKKLYMCYMVFSVVFAAILLALVSIFGVDSINSLYYGYNGSYKTLYILYFLYSLIAFILHIGITYKAKELKELKFYFIGAGNGLVTLIMLFIYVICSVNITSTLYSNGCHTNSTA